MLWLSIALTVWAVLGYLAFLKHLEAQKPIVLYPAGDRVEALEKATAELTARLKSVEMGIAMRRGA